MQFSSVEELDRHSLVPQIEVCELRQDKITEGLTLDMEKLIRVRKRIPRNQTDEECWMAIYRLLFPKDETVPGPCKSYLLVRFNVDGHKIKLRCPMPTFNPSNYWHNGDIQKPELIPKQILTRIAIKI